MKFSGFMNVYQLDDMSWEYQFGDKTLKAPTLKELELLVNLYMDGATLVQIDAPNEKLIGDVIGK